MEVTTNDVYSVDIFISYKEANAEPHQNFEKYYVNKWNDFKFKHRDIFDRPDIKTRLN